MSSLELDPVDVEEDRELGLLPTDAMVNRCQWITPSSWLWMPVRTNSSNPGSVCASLLPELHPGVTQVEPVRLVPVVVDGRLGRIGGGSALTRVHDQGEAEDDDDRDDQGERCAALEADLLALARLGELGGFLGG